MALMTCFDCKTEMSETAKACPKCGWVPLSGAEKPEGKSSPLILPGMIVGGIGGAMAFLGYGVFGVLVAIAGIAMFLVGMVSGKK